PLSQPTIPMTMGALAPPCGLAWEAADGPAAERPPAGAPEAGAPEVAPAALGVPVFDAWAGVGEPATAPDVELSPALPRGAEPACARPGVTPFCARIAPCDSRFPQADATVIEARRTPTFH